MLPDLHTARERIRAGQTTAADELGRSLQAARSPACAHAFTRLHPEMARHAAEFAANGAKPLAGLPVSVKDLFDIAGNVTTAGSAVLADAPPARHDAAAVARLKAAGAAIVGRTNMTEFAFSGMGINPHHGTPANPCDTAVARIPGGSTSGGAVSVAAGAAFVALGSDTGGSIRIPAALCGLVGFKNTARLTPTEGALPLSTTLDTACAMTRSVRDAILAHEILAARTVTRSGAPISSYRFAVAQTQMFDGIDAAVARAFERAVRTLRDAGATIEEIPLAQIQDLGTIQATGGFAAAESYAWHRQLLERKGEAYDPRVRARIERGAGMKAWEYLQMVEARRAWMAEVAQALRGFDAVLSPTVPIVAPPLAPVAPGAERDAEFFRTNALLLRNPSVVNMLDGCAVSLPCHEPGELPAGLMIWHGALRDDTILNIALQAERLIAPFSPPLMKIAIVGAGIVGVTTAYELAADGHAVTVFERRGAAALETSFANAGVVAPGYVTPWAAPGMPAKVLRYLLSQHAPVRVAWPLGMREMSWMLKWRRACEPATYAANRARMQRLAFYSRERLHGLIGELQLEYDRSAGYMVMLRSDKDRKLVQPGLQVLRDAGVNFREIDAQQARAVEPALNTDTDFAGAIHLPDDEVGNCRQFALLLKNEAQALGANFVFNAAVAPLDAAQPTQLRVSSEDGTQVLRFDAIVVCGGVDSTPLLRPLGIRLPLVAVHGYSISAPIREPLNAPRSGIMDERYKVAISRLGNRVRVAGSAEIGGAPEFKRPSAIQTLYKVLHDWFPGAAQLANTGAAVQEWKGARPMLPDGPPLLGATGIPGVWLNLGHGSSGWALSCGSARAVADLMAGRAPDIDVEGLGIERLAS